MPSIPLGTHTAFYEECGSGHPLLLLHGLGSNRLSWRHLFGPLSRYHVIALDQRDSGDSALGAQPYSIAQVADDAAGVLTALQAAPAYVIGISMGGMVSLELTLRHPELVDKLVLISTTAGGAAHVQPRPEAAALLMMDPKIDLETRIRKVYGAIAAPGFAEAHPEAMNQVVETQAAKPMSPASYQRQLGACIMHNAVDRLNKINIPTLILHGDLDPLIPYPNGEYLSKHIAGAQFSTYSGVGHLIPLEAPERFVKEVTAFLG